MVAPHRRALHGLLRTVWFRRIRVLGAERLPAARPVLWLGLHRNGALDGFVYAGVAPRAEFLIAAQLRRGWVARLFFEGIEVVRGKDDGDRSANAAALEGAAALLARGGEIGVFPEGTSDLGPRVLPLHAGAAHLLLGALAAGTRPAVIPLGLHYERAWCFRDSVEIVAVFVDATRDEILKTTRQLGIRTVQLHGAETPEFAESLEGLQVIKAFHIATEADVEQINGFPAMAYLLDAGGGEMPGGTGRAVNWELARKATRYGRFFLAGGLTPENVAAAIRSVRPWGVDTASGVEISPGVKDRRKVDLFIRNARRGAAGTQPGR